MLPFGPQHAVVGGHGTRAALYLLAAALAALLALRRFAGRVPSRRP